MNTVVDDPFALVVGQERAIEQLRGAAQNPVHAYLFVGPRGAGKRRAAAAVAGEWIGAPSDRERSRRMVRTEDHPDLIVFEPEGNAYLMIEAEQVVVAASRAPVEGGAKVIVLDRFHDASAEVAAKLLKTIEEPPPSTRFVLLAQEVPPEHVTIASRSTRIDFPSVPVTAIAEALSARGVEPDLAKAAAEGSGGDVSRAELLVDDVEFAERRAMWWDAPSRLDGSGFAATEVAKEVRKAIEEAQAPLDAKHVVESATMDATEELTGTRGSGRRAMEARHKREARLHRTDEWRMGLATLALRYRSAVVDGSRDPAIFATLNDAAEALVRNPNEELWLTALLLELPPLPSG
ncbi:MAG: hypothetical protein ACR2P0_03755 [Acidimicrobiales bacterium]